MSRLPRSPAAERQRRYRERRRRGYLVAPTPTHETLHIDMLIAGWGLSERDAADPKKVGEAISRLLDALAKNPLRVTPIGVRRD